MREYDHKKIERKWQDIWEKEGLYKTPDTKEGAENYYMLTEFLYPSGNLHVGHWYAFAVPDIFARKKRMEGKNVLYPMGFDSFGLPAENAAIKRGKNPREWTHENIAHMTEQLKSMGNSFDWSRAVTTSDLEYYKWTQWLFLALYKKGLAYRDTALVNWCPSCKTVLANEQVVNNRCERCDTEVLKKELEQWFLKITDYAERLLSDLNSLPWPKEIKDAERNWIGRSDGAEISFPVNSNQGVKKALVIHGFTGSPSANWMPWIEKELEKLGIETSVAAWPNPNHPSYGEAMAYLEKEFESIGPDDIVIGHSLGGYFALKLAEQKQIGTIVLVAPAVGNMPYEKWRKEAPPTEDVEALINTIESHKVDFSNIKAKRKIALFGEDDGDVPPDSARAFDSSWAVQVVKNVGHFTKSTAPNVLFAIRPEIKVFTTRPDTLFGATYLVLAPEHPLLENQELGIKNQEEVEKYIREAKKKTDIERLAADKEKTGVEIKGVKAINPATKEEIPIFVADYVLATYGTGAIMAVPAHDERDHEFAKKFNLPIRKVIDSENEEGGVYTNVGTMVNSAEFNGLPSEEVRQKITDFVGGALKTTYRLRDWLISRQRYWGAPIPVVYDPEGRAHPVPEEHLPWELPNDVDFMPTGEAPLARSKELAERTEKIFGKGWRPEIDTMDTFVDSSWYFLRYLDPKNAKEFSSKTKQKLWMPVDLYSGGAEHTTMHLLYSRFFYKALYDLGLVTESEPYRKRMNRGLVLGPDGHKMSKSRGNIIDPDENVARVGADAVKMYLAFIGPYNETGSYPWDMGGIVGMRRFLEKVWRLQYRIKNSQIPERSSVRGKQELRIKNERIETALHKTIKKVGEDIEAFKFNTAISALMIFVSNAEKEGLAAEQYETFLCLLAPFAPHMTEELWREELGHTSSIHTEPWPEYSPEKIKEDTMTIVIQVNGKVRDQFEAASEEGEEAIKEEALNRETIQKWTTGKKIKKVIYVPKKLVNVVVF